MYGVCAAVTTINSCDRTFACDDIIGFAVLAYDGSFFFYVETMGWIAAFSFIYVYDRCGSPSINQSINQQIISLSDVVGGAGEGGASMEDRKVYGLLLAVTLALNEDLLAEWRSDYEVRSGAEARIPRRLCVLKIGLVCGQLRSRSDHATPLRGKTGGIINSSSTAASTGRCILTSIAAGDFPYTKC